MNWKFVSSFVLVLCLISETATCKTSLPKIKIGHPTKAEYDVAGSPISEKEFQDSRLLKVTDDFDSTRDPITSSGYYQGDIRVDSEDHLLQLLQGDPKGLYSAIRNPQNRWPQAVIPYEISSEFGSTGSSERAVIAKAMSEYHDNTCIRFVPKTNSHQDYIYIGKGSGCSSNVGRRGGRQFLSLGNGCVYVGIVIHELMHAAGFWHEQSRYDRDDYVTINYGNIIQGLEYNFDKSSQSVSTDLGLSYDYSSIMHYGPRAFSRNGSPTIVPRQSGVTIGQRRGFSELDIKGLNLLYDCSGVNPEPTPGPEPEDCEDNNGYCQYWAARGYCSSYREYMQENCKKSCDACGEGSCQDESRNCQDWAEQGFCFRYTAFMSQYCQKSCGRC